MTASTALFALRRGSCRRQRLLLLAALVLAALLVGQVRPNTPARAFDLDSHEAILRAALTTAMSGDALDEVTNYGIAVPSSGEPELSNLALAPGASLHGLTFEQLWDNAPDATAICGRLATVTAVLKYALDQAAPKGTAYKELTDGKKARRAFGLAAVLLSNFYAHSNWVELAADQGIMPVPAQLAGNCGPGSLPAKLQTGYFNAASGPDGCPKTGATPKPPAPYSYCFSQLSKDSGDSGHGAQRATKLAGQPTYHDLAQQLAIDATKQLFTGLHNTIVQTYTPESWNANGQCVFDKLVRSNADPDDIFANSNVVFSADTSCLDISGQWTVNSEMVDGQAIEGDDIGKIIGVTQAQPDATGQAHVTTVFRSADAGACPFGEARTYYIDATLVDAALQGTTAQCTLNSDIATYCSGSGSDEVSFTGTVEGNGQVRTLHLQFLSAEWFIERDDAGNVVNCERDAPEDLPNDVLLQRTPPPAP
jgi:hypothetical protein